MPASVFTTPRFIGLALLATAAAAVVLTSALAAGTDSLAIACGGCAVAASIYTLAELAACVLPNDRPLERMLLGMSVRGFGALAAVTLAVAAAGFDTKTVALVAMPLYAALLAGEVASALVQAPNQAGS